MVIRVAVGRQLKPDKVAAVKQPKRDKVAAARKVGARKVAHQRDRMAADKAVADAGDRLCPFTEVSGYRG